MSLGVKVKVRGKLLEAKWGLTSRWKSLEFTLQEKGSHSCLGECFRKTSIQPQRIGLIGMETNWRSRAIRFLLKGRRTCPKQVEMVVRMERQGRKDIVDRESISDQRRVDREKKN